MLNQLQSIWEGTPGKLPVKSWISCSERTDKLCFWVSKIYLDETREGTYRLKRIEISSEDLERLRELDDLNVLCYGRHLIEDFESET